MNRSADRYVLGMELITPTGMNLEIAQTVAKADLGRFEQLEGDDGIERFTYAKIDYTKAKTVLEKTCELSGYILRSLLEQLPQSLKPIPLIIAVSREASLVKVQEWIEESSYSGFISKIDVVHSDGASFVLKAIKSLDENDAIMCIHLDSLVEVLGDLVKEGKVMSTNNPWGIIPSEGGAGLILCRRNIVETLKLKPKATLGYLDVELGATDRRGMYRLVQRASQHIESFGEVYSDMSNLRAHTEDYGFALGAKAERFVQPQKPHLINELWGTMGGSSSLALIAYAVKNHHFNQPTTVMMFGPEGDKAILQLLA
ncbi:hypothetical protein FCU94_04815 [Vibrio sp. JPW-9-11-11]|uniref:hypothetical protein n=1 Tax=Vibrio sp. JPW-9-11-11 TaxID=1416532 RepID=UPI0015936D52|nr:hypothetical protein [Vibrio sp. JPW-9-11-11]NVD06231.1 hypothetical protein [Vibrio sp. JPW-9-11-11]